jgi:hypothetical protein
MTTITADRPDPRFYIKIIQHDDGNWEAEPMPLDDVTRPLLLGMVVTIPGLRSVTKVSVNKYTETFIFNYAPNTAQNNALYVLSHQTSGPEFDDANAMFTWINAVRARSNEINASIDTMTFDQLVVFLVPSAGWPNPPASLQ